MAKREVNVPAMKNFVEMLYFNALDLAKKSRHVSVSLHTIILFQVLLITVGNFRIVYVRLVKSSCIEIYHLKVINTLLSDRLFVR